MANIINTRSTILWAEFDKYCFSRYSLRNTNVPLDEINTASRFINGRYFYIEYIKQQRSWKFTLEGDTTIVNEQNFESFAVNEYDDQHSEAVIVVKPCSLYPTGKIVNV